MTDIKKPKKLIEVALPLDDINAACMHEKQPGIGSHPRGLHLWWARRPLPAARAVIFAQMVNDPGYEVGKGFKRGVNKQEAEVKREELFDIIRELVKWENTNNESVLQRAKDAIKESWLETCQLNKNHPKAAELFDPENIPEFHDPFAGGGAIPIEAQRLGLNSFASDLNPVAVMINKAMIEIPPLFNGLPPVCPDTSPIIQSKLLSDWVGCKGLAEDIRRYGDKIHHRAKKKLKQLYPKIKITEDIVKDREDLVSYLGQELEVLTYIWARTVKSPNPAFKDVKVPIVSNFALSTKKGKEAYIDIVIKEDGNYEFIVKRGPVPAQAKKGTKSARGPNFICALSSTPINGEHIKSEGKLKQLGTKLMAVVLKGKRGRVYLSASEKMEFIAKSEKPNWRPEMLIPHDKRSMFTPLYGMERFGDLFTDRQLVSLNTYMDLIKDIKSEIFSDCIKSELNNDQIRLEDGGSGALAYTEAIMVYLSFVIDRLADYNSSISTWKASGEQVMQTYKRQAIPMTWDFPESNVTGETSICWLKSVKYTADNLESTNRLSNIRPGRVAQADAATQSISENKVISTDPPYYDNIGYADLSDFFYVWMRRNLREIYPSLFSTMAVPKEDELVANPYRQGSKESAESFFLNGMSKAIHNLAINSHPGFPVSIYYAFKSSETKEGNTGNTGWETFLEAVIRSGFSIDGTWPMRTELANRMIGAGNNALASSVVLVCNKRSETAKTISRREFQRELRQKMPDALEAMIGGEEGASPIAPVDLAQSAIGPGIAIYSNYKSIIESDGSTMSVHDALILINRAITEYLNPDAGNFDEDTLFCDDWFSQYGWGEGVFGEADTLARAKGTSVDGVKEAGVIESGGGKVRLLKWEEYPSDWDPKNDNRTAGWEACHQLIRALNQQGEESAGALLSRMPERGENIRQLAYHLYTLCERKGWAEEARAYNELIGSWHSIVAASHEAGHVDEQIGMDF